MLCKNRMISLFIMWVFNQIQEQKMKSKNDNTKPENDLTNPRRKNAILTPGAGFVAAVGIAAASS